MADSPAYFRFTDTDGKPRFVIELRDPDKIAHARRILSGEERSRIHVQGTVVKESAPYNPGWSFHLDPGSIDFFEFATEVCDASIQYVEDHLGEVGGSTLPGSHWCPWSSRLVQEGFTRANVFELFGEAIQVSYSSPNVLGGPRLSYRDSQRSLFFQGEDIRSQTMELGELITVTLEAIPDFRTITFTLILPTVTVMSQSSGTYIRVPGVTATNPTTLAGPPPGPERLYSVVTLQGTAQFIVS